MTKHAFRRFLLYERGQDLVEYALLLSCIALVVIVGLRSLGTAVNGKYLGVSAAISAAGSGGSGNNGSGNGNNGNNGNGNNGNGNNGNGNNGNGNGNGNGGNKP